MDIIAELKRQACERRNEAFNLARAEYRQSLEQIESLRRGLGLGYQRVSRSKTQPLQDLVAELVPKAGTFTVNDMVLMMRKKHPLRNFNVPTIRTIVPKLAEQGIIRKVSRDAKGCVLWASVHATVSAPPLDAMTLTEAAEFMLASRGPLRLVELVILLQQAGFRVKADPRRLMQSLRWANRRYPGRFNVDGKGRWSCI